MRFRTSASVLVHVGLFSVAFLLAYGLRFEFSNFELWFRQQFLPLLPLVVVLKLVVFFRMGLHRGSWRYVGVRDLLNVLIASYVATFAFIVVYYVAANISVRIYGRLLFDRFPPSIFMLDFGLTVAVVSGARLFTRLYHEFTRPVASGGPISCLIVGAGDTGEVLLREILRMDVERYRVVGFLDDDPGKLNVRIHGVPVLGRIEDARRIAEQEQVDDLLIAMPEVGHSKLRRVVEQCQGTNLRFRTIPALADVIGGAVTVSRLRDVDINDLLGRPQARLDEQVIADRITGQRVLITGAGGSIGSELCRQVVRFRPARLILLEAAENNMFEIDRELAALAPDIPRTLHIADVKDESRVDAVFAAEKPNLVFHAAAHKHVPMMELNVGEAIKNNIHGTRVAADAARRHGVSRFVMISTDKAVNPTSVMGTTKRVAEMYIQQLGGGEPTQFITVRFGNVLGSSGSVVPIFRKQIAAGGPVTVTDPRMTRYFMTIPEASQLVLQAGAMGHHGDIFVLDMGEPVKILDLAKEMITLSGLRPGEDIEIKFTGVRPGEKLYEELSISGEDVRPTHHEQIFVWRNRPEQWDHILRGIDNLLAAADTSTPDELRAKLLELVPEYKWRPGGAAPATDQVATEKLADDVALTAPTVSPA